MERDWRCLLWDVGVLDTATRSSHDFAAENGQTIAIDAVGTRHPPLRMKRHSRMSFYRQRPELYSMLWLRLDVSFVG